VVAFLPFSVFLVLPVLVLVAAYYPSFEDPSPLALAMFVAAEIAGFALGIAAMTGLYLWWVPLEKR
jgi:hypothetical protein